MLGCRPGIGAAKIPMETQDRHHASFSLSSRISMPGAFFS